MGVYNTYKALFDDDTFSMIVAKDMQSAVNQVADKNIEVIKVEDKGVLYVDESTSKMTFNAYSNSFGRVYPVSGVLDKGNSVIFTAIPNNNGRFVSFTYDGEEIFENPVTITRYSDFEIQANFEEIEEPKVYHTITTSYNDTLGAIYPQETTVLDGEHLDISVIPNEGIKLKSVTIGDLIITDFTDNKLFYRIENILNDLTISADFAEQVVVTLESYSTSTIDKNSTFTLPILENTENEIFKGWFNVTENRVSNQEEIIVQDTIYRPIWIPATVTITYESGNSNVVLSKTSDIVDNETVFTLPIPQNIGEYKFVGWYIDNENELYTTYKVTSDITFIAKWELIEFVTVSFDKLIESSEVPKGSIYTLPEIDNIYFDHFELNGSTIENSIQVNENITINVILSTSTINFYTNNENYSEYVPSPVTLDNGSTYHLPSIDNDSFIGYFVDNVEIDSTITVTSPMTIELRFME